MARTHCKCGSPLIEGGITTKYRYCVPCTRSRAAQRRRSNAAAQIEPVEVRGARERLKAYMNQHADAVDTILEFVADRRPDYIGERAA